MRPWESVPILTELEAQLPERTDIPRLADRILAGDAETIDIYPSWSEAEYACLCSLINAGHEFESCKRLFLRKPAAGKFAEKYARNPREAFAWLELSYRSAAGFVLSNPGPARELAYDLRNWAESRPWAGRTGATDRAVYLAHLSIVERCGRQPYGASCRESAELAGVSWKTASVATRRLRDDGLLILIDEATATLSNRYRLVDLTDGASRHTHSQSLVGECEPTHIEHDAFRWSGLNKSGAEVWTVLLRRGEATEGELALATGRHRTTIGRKLNVMFQLGMVEPLGNGYWRVLPDVDLDVIAEELGTAGLGERQKRSHQRQRRLHRRAVAHCRQSCDTK